VKRYIWIIIVFFLSLSVHVYSIEFFINTKDGIGVCGNYNNVSYTIGYPYSEIGLEFPVGNEKNFFVAIFGGADLLNNITQASFNISFKAENFKLSIPFIISTKPPLSNEASEVGRVYVGIVPSLAVFKNLEIEFSNYYSWIYLWYDPAFEVNIPSIRSDDVFRSKLGFKVSYVLDSLSFGMGYNMLIKWLSYRSSFISKDDALYFEAKFKVKF
jgi:hypothetical protein